jgi:hypothetical protein
MAKHPWLVQRNGVYYVRAPVPKNLVASLNGKREITYSLKTKDRKIADRRIIDEAKRIADLFDEHRLLNVRPNGAPTECEHAN